MTEDFIYAASGAMLIKKYSEVDGKLPRIAYLAPRSILEDGDCGVKVAAQFGFYGAKRTTSIDDALEWIGSENS